MNNVVALPINRSEIDMFFHCKDCLDELPAGMAPREYVDFECGWTTKGFQVWCMRHNKNVIHMDFEGHKHPVIE